jgi:RNA polymerase sigma-70 factor (ECF subfamily)
MKRVSADSADEDVLARAAAGDEAALGELYDRFGAVAYGLALRVLRDRALAEDAVQEAFIAVWRQGGRYSTARGSARTWILTLVHRRAVDLVRRQERQPTAVAEPEPSREQDEGGADDAAVMRDERARVQAALAQLPDDQRVALELAYYGGLTQSELAARLGEPVGTIKSRMFNGLRRLRAILAAGEGVAV